MSFPAFQETRRLRVLECVLSTLLRSYLRSDRTQGGGEGIKEFLGTRYCIPRMRGPRPRQGGFAPCTPGLQGVPV